MENQILFLKACRRGIQGDVTELASLTWLRMASRHKGPDIMPFLINNIYKYAKALSLFTHHIFLFDIRSYVPPST